MEPWYPASLKRANPEGPELDLDRTLVETTIMEVAAGPHLRALEEVREVQWLLPVGDCWRMEPTSESMMPRTPEVAAVDPGAPHHMEVAPPTPPPPLLEARPPGCQEAAPALALDPDPIR